MVYGTPVKDRIKSNAFLHKLGAIDRGKVTCPLTYFASGAQARSKPAMPLDSAPTKQVLPQGQFKIDNKPQATMSGKTNIIVNQ